MIQSVASPQLSEEARNAFAHTLMRWRRRAGWAHDTLHKWGDAAGFETVKNSVFSRMERGLNESPGLVTFIHLGECNRRIAEGDLGVIQSARLRDVLKAQTPICHPDGTPWDAVDFFAHFIGKLPAPDELQDDGQPDYLSDPAAAQAVAERQRTLFIATAEERFLDRREAWDQLVAHCDALSEQQRGMLRSVLAGHHQWKPEELAAQLRNGELLSDAALMAWCKGA